MQTLSPWLVLGILGAYFLLLVGVAYWTGRRVDASGFFLAGRRAPWYVVAYGMIGVSISGVTFISAPGAVGLASDPANGIFPINRGLGYFQMVLGYLAGYLFIGLVLMPLYYRLQLTSIYGYLERRFGRAAWKTGAGFFLLSRTLGSATRMFLAALVLQEFVFRHFGVPFELTAALMLALIYAYTFRGGMKTLIWTDVIMTTFFLAAVVWTVSNVVGALQLDAGSLVSAIRESRYGQVFFWDHFARDPNHFVKQFVGGAFVAIVMTGLDQDLMQKNLSCRNIRDAQKNMSVFCIYMVLINIAFLTLGALLYLYADASGIEIPERTDYLYPKIAFFHLEVAAGIFFILGLVASTYASSDSALTALTTSFCIDFLQFEKKWQEADPYASDEEQQAWRQREQARQKRLRTLTHLGFSILFAAIIIVLEQISRGAVITLLFQIAAYTYGPLLGLFTFGLFTRRRLRSAWILPVCIVAPALTWLIDQVSKPEFHMGFLTFPLNGLICFVALWAISEPEAVEERP